MPFSTMRVALEDLTTGRNMTGPFRRLQNCCSSACFQNERLGIQHAAWLLDCWLRTLDVVAALRLKICVSARRLDSGYMTFMEV